MNLLLRHALLAIACSTTLTACGAIRSTATGSQALRSAVTSTVCRSFQPIWFSDKRDTKETVRQVREHNASYQTFRCKPFK